MSKSQNRVYTRSAETRAKIAAALRGKKKSDAHCASLSAARKGTTSEVRRLDITNIRYGMLVALRRVEPPAECVAKNRSYWLCRCDCGKERIFAIARLRTQGIDHCGCQRSQRMGQWNKKAFGTASAHVVYVSYVRAARDRGLAFELTKDELLAITKRNCYYCGTPPSQISRQKHANGAYIYNGVDRVDNTLGYTATNCVACCKYCNRMKMNSSLSEFLAQIWKITHHLEVSFMRRVA